MVARNHLEPTLSKFSSCVHVWQPILARNGLSVIQTNFFFRLYSRTVIILRAIPPLRDLIRPYQQLFTPCSALHTRFLAHRLANVTRLWRGMSGATLHTRPKRGLLLQPSPLLFAHVFETMLPTCFFFQNCLKSRARNCAFRSEQLWSRLPDVFRPSGTCVLIQRQVFYPILEVQVPEARKTSGKLLHSCSEREAQVRARDLRQFRMEKQVGSIVSNT